MNINDLEIKVYLLEEVRLVVRAPVGTPVIEYPYTRKAPGNMRVKDWLATRIHPLLNEMTVIILDGHCIVPNPSSTMEKLRQTYAR